MTMPVKPVTSIHFTNSWHRSSGGISTFYRALLDAAQVHGRRVSLVVPGDQDRTEEWNPHATIHVVAAPRSPFDSNYRCILPPAYLPSASRIAAILSGDQPDVVEVCDKYTLPYVGGLLRLGRLPGVNRRPTVIGLSCERMDENLFLYTAANPFTRVFARLYMKWIYFPLCDHHIAVTMHTGGELETASHGHKVRRGVWVEPMGVDAETFHPSRRSAEKRRELLRRCRAKDSAVLLLYAGRLAREKNLDLLLAAMRDLYVNGRREFHLLIAGSGPLLSRLRSDADACPGRIHFLGHYDSREKLAELYANCDVFTHPNPREPFGIAPLEAMASGLPLVCPETGGIRSYATPLVSWPVPADPASFARGITEASLDEPLRHSKVRQARQTAERHAWPNVCARYFRLYDELHALRSTGRHPSMPAGFYSTPGNWLGVETRSPGWGTGLLGDGG